jgi:hypothetical protein
MSLIYSNRDKRTCHHTLNSYPVTLVVSSSNSSSSFSQLSNSGPGRAIAQAVSRWLPTAAARVRSRVWSSGICGGQSGGGAVFSEYFAFPCQSLFHKILHHLGQATIGQSVADVPSGSSWTPPPIKRKITRIESRAGHRQSRLTSFHDFSRLVWASNKKVTENGPRPLHLSVPRG